MFLWSDYKTVFFFLFIYLFIYFYFFIFLFFFFVFFFLMPLLYRCNQQTSHIYAEKEFLEARSENWFNQSTDSTGDGQLSLNEG